MTLWRGANRGRLPQIRWGANRGNALDFGVPAQEIQAYLDPYTVGRSRLRLEGSRSVDVVTRGQDGLWQGMVLAIPPTGQVGPYGVWRSGWNDTTGWQAFLAWAFLARPFLFIPDRANPTQQVLAYLETPKMGAGAPGSGFNGRTDLKLGLRAAVSGTTFPGF